MQVCRHNFSRDVGRFVTRWIPKLSYFKVGTLCKQVMSCHIDIFRGIRTTRVLSKLDNCNFHEALF